MPGPQPIKLNCDCYYCEAGEAHVARHTRWDAEYRGTVPDSLDPRTRIEIRICQQCGHMEKATMTPLQRCIAGS